MKLSIFKKTALWLMIILLGVEIIMFFALYSYTSKNAIDRAYADVTEAAKVSAPLATFADPDKFEIESEEETIIVDAFSGACNQYDVDIIYLLLPDLQNNTVMYLTRGISSKQFAKDNSHPVDDLNGSFVEGGLTGEIKKALSGDDSGITAHVTNDKEDKLVCYVPVKYYGDSGKGEIPKIKSLICAQISLDRIMNDINARFREFAVILLIATAVTGISAAVILYFKVSKPLTFISKKMKAFVSERGTEFEKLPVKGKDELAEMSDSFNNMAEEIDLYIDDVAELNRQKAELNIAQKIQLGLLEPSSFQNEAASIYASMAAAKTVGGDLYDYRVLKNGNIFVAIADVSGKGITAALFMSRAITLLNQYAELGYSPAEMLFAYNNQLAAHNPNVMFITTFAAVYNTETMELTYSNAGHNFPYVLSDRLIALNEMGGMVAGAFPGEQYPEYTVKLKAGDKLFLYTDGVTEAQDKDGSFFGEERLEKALLNHRDSGADGLINAVTAEINEFAKGAEQADDITMLALQVK